MEQSFLMVKGLCHVIQIQRSSLFYLNKFRKNIQDLTIEQQADTLRTQNVYGLAQ